MIIGTETRGPKLQKLMFLLFAYGELIFYLILMVFVMNFLEIFLTFFYFSSNFAAVFCKMILLGYY
jgi:hypothetical protein